MEGYVVMIVGGGIALITGLMIMGTLTGVITVDNNSPFYQSYQNVVNFIGISFTLGGISLIVAGAWGLLKIIRS